MSDQARLGWMLLLSVIVHGLVLSLMSVGRHANVSLSVPSFIDVDLVQLPKPAPPARAVPPSEPVPEAAPPPVIPIPDRQIVSMPEQGEEKEPQSTRFLSDRDNTVPQEMVRRGDPPPGDPDARRVAPQREPAKAASSAPARPARSAESRQKQLAALPRLDQLLPQAGDFARESKRRLPPPEPAPADSQEAAAETGRDLLRYGDPWRRGSVRGGTLDFLPNVREGDITLLNTKAERFAPFVRRVALRVFENFWILTRRSHADGGAAEEYAALEAVMDREGNLIRIVPLDRSISSAFATDRNLQAAIREGFFDRNPPKGAEREDGNIHFAFHARVVLVVTPGGRRVPQWALMGAGLM